MDRTVRKHRRHHRRVRILGPRCTQVHHRVFDLYLVHRLEHPGVHHVRNELLAGEQAARSLADEYRFDGNGEDGAGGSESGVSLLAVRSIGESELGCHALGNVT